MLQNLLLLLHNTAAPCKKNYFKLQLAVQTFTHRWHKVMAGEKKSAQRLLLLMRKHHWMSEMCTFFSVANIRYLKMVETKKYMTGDQ